MKRQLVISEKKVLEYNEKAFKDTAQLLSKASEDVLDRTFKAVDEIGKDYTEVLNNLHFEKGRTLWVELKVEDSFLSTMLYGWLFSKSDVDNTPLHALGCSVLQIMFSKPNNYTPEEIHAIKMLYEKAVGVSSNGG